MSTPAGQCRLYFEKHEVCATRLVADVYARIPHMKRTTIFIDETLEHDLHSLAGQRGVPLAELVCEALGRYLAEQNSQKESRLCFLAAGRSGQKNISSNHERLLWQDLRHHGTETSAVL